MTTILNAYDRRQLLLIDKQLFLLKEGKIDLGTLVSRLEALLNVIESVNIAWKDLFQSEWANLELVYANLLYTGHEELNLFEKEFVNQTINNLNDMVLNILKTSLNQNKTLNNSIKRALLIQERWLMCPDCSEAWKPSSCDAMIICPACDQLLQNPLIEK